MLRKMPKEEALRFNNTIHDIQRYDYQWSETVLGEKCHWVGDIQEEDTAYVELPPNSYDTDYRYSLNNIPLVEGYKYIKSLDYGHFDLTTEDTISGEESIGYSCNDSTFIFHTIKYGDFIINHKNLDDKKVYTYKSVKGDAAFICTKLSISDDKKGHKDMRLHINGYFLYNNPVKE